MFHHLLHSLLKKVQFNNLVATHTLVFFLCVFLFLPSFAHATIYEPGATLNPACAPTASECRVRTPLVQDAEEAVQLSTATSTPATTSNRLYNIAGVLYWNGSAVAGASGLTSINGLSSGVQTFATSSNTSAFSFDVSSSGSTHTFSLALQSGYDVPLSASTTEWATAYGWGDHAVAGYLTTAAASSSFLSIADWSATTTDALAEGSTNQYWTSGRFASALAGTTTDALAEGSSNLYFTNTRADARIAAATTTVQGMFAAGTGLSYSSGTFTNTGVTALGSLTGSVATSSLAIALSDTTGTLSVSRGGTGLTNIANNAIIIGAGSSAFATTSRGDLSAGNGIALSGSGSNVLIGASATLALDINNLAQTSSVSASNTIAIYDGSSVKKINRSDFLQGITSALTYQGTWDANTNTPSLTDGVGTDGYMYVANTATTTLNLGSGALTVNSGDLIIYTASSSKWQVAPSGSSVASVFGRTGAVVASSGDYTASQVTFVATSTLASTNVQAAIEELLGEGGLTSLNGLTGSTQTFADDTNVTITSAGTTHTLGWTGQLAAARGGTGLGSVTANQLLIGNSGGTGWMQVATSSLGLLTTNVAEGSNLYFTNTRADARIATATTTVQGMFVAGTGLSYVGGTFTNTGVTALGSLTGSVATSSLAIALSDTTGTLSVSRGGTGATSLTGLLLGNGTSAFTATTTLSSSYIEDAFLKNNGDTATGSYNFDAGTLYVDATNNRIGIGTTSPATELHLSGSNSPQLRLETTHATESNVKIDFYARGSRKWSIQNDWAEAGEQNFNIYDAVAGLKRFVIASNGNTGIGTDSPANKLAVNGGIYLASTTPAATTNALYNNGGTLYWNGSEVGSGSSFWSQVSTNIASTSNNVLKMNGNTAIYISDQSQFYGSIFVGSSGGASLSHTFGTQGNYNTAVGVDTMHSITTGAYNTALGSLALNSVTTAGSNTAVGYQALTSNTGAANSAFGSSVLSSNTTGSFNAAFGNYALFSNSTGTNNLAMGAYAGRYAGSGTTANVSGDYNTYLGNYTRAGTSGNTNEIVIGYNALGLGSNTAVLGNDSITDTFLKGRIAIGTTTSQSNKLYVSGSARITGALYDSNGSAGSSGYSLQSTGSGLAWTYNPVTTSGGSGTPYDVSTASYTRIALDPSPQGNGTAASLFNNDGTKLYVLNYTDDEINEYALSTPYDISTKSFTQIALSVAAEEGTPADITFNNDGTKLYLLGQASDDINEYALSTPYDISTASFTQIALSVAAQETTPTGMTFNDDGTTLYVIGYIGDDVNEYALSTPYDISTASFTQIALSVAAQGGGPTDLIFNNDGAKLYVLDYMDDEINEYALSTPYDISTASFTQIALSTVGQESIPRNLLFNNDGTALYMTGSGTIKIYEYTIPFTTGSVHLTDSTASFGIGTTTPTAQFHTTGTLRFSGLGAGTLTADASGNVTVSSDVRLKNVDGSFTRGLSAIQGLEPASYHWNEASGLETEHSYTGFIAQNVQEFIPEAVATSTSGYLTLSDRPITAALVNAVKEISAVADENASTSITAEDGATTKTFVGKFFDRLVAWFGDATNGIGDFFANRIHSKELCIGEDGDETCITKSQLDTLLSGQTAAAENSSGGDNENTNTGVVGGSTNNNTEGTETETQTDEVSQSSEEGSGEEIAEESPATSGEEAVEETPSTDGGETPAVTEGGDTVSEELTEEPVTEEEVTEEPAVEETPAEPEPIPEPEPVPVVEETPAEAPVE